MQAVEASAGASSELLAAAAAALAVLTGEATAERQLLLQRTLPPECCFLGLAIPVECAASTPAALLYSNLIAGQPVTSALVPGETSTCGAVLRQGLPTVVRLEPNSRLPSDLVAARQVWGAGVVLATPIRPPAPVAPRGAAPPGPSPHQCTTPVGALLLGLPWGADWALPGRSTQQAAVRQLLQLADALTTEGSRQLQQLAVDLSQLLGPRPRPRWRRAASGARSGSDSGSSSSGGEEEEEEEERGGGLPVPRGLSESGAGEAPGTSARGAGERRPSDRLDWLLRFKQKEEEERFLSRHSCMMLKAGPPAGGHHPGGGAGGGGGTTAA